MTCWPDWLDEANIMAKSPEKGGETLAEHTWQVMCRLSDQMRLRSMLDISTDSYLWTWMFWAVLLHDFGKAAAGFQAMLRSEAHSWHQDYQHRHEILSLGFVDWLFPKSNSGREWIIAAIATHHKDANGPQILRYGGNKPMKQLSDKERDTIKFLIADMANQINNNVRFLLWRWLDECASSWATELGFPEPDMSILVPWDQAESTDLAKSTFQALRDLTVWRENLPEHDIGIATIVRGLILTADHAASAGADAFPAMPLNRDVAWKPVSKFSELRAHQQAAQDVKAGSALMIAPTGSGKTEAAMLWAAQQMAYRPAARLFYTLPYQASMNAMAERLASRYFGTTLIADNNRAVTIQHSRATLKFYQDMMDADESDPRAVKRAAKWKRNLAQLNFYPIQVFSPYQMLKAAYSLKGYETLLLDYTDALFIFDEIHAYDPARMALIITMIGWLAERFQARFLIMTATLPPTVQEALKTEFSKRGLPDWLDIEASPEVFQQAQRHSVQMLDGNLADHLSLIEQDVNSGKTVLVCCNRVAHAQNIYRALADSLDLRKDEIVLLHSRFNGRDRAAREKRLLETVGVGVNKKVRPKRFVVVATQVVEVSLDIDLDTIYTEPAPLEALLQRFGRVNRGRTERELLPVHVFGEPIPGKGDNHYLPYVENIVHESVQVLKDFCQNRPIDEAQVNDMLAEIYSQEEISDEWWATYRKCAQEFEDAVLGIMKPFVSADLATYHKFYELFDGVEVLPAEHYDVYLDVAKNKGYLAASQYLVSISWQQYHMLKNDGLVIGREEDEYVDQVNVDYDPDFGLDLDGARQKAKERRG